MAKRPGSIEPRSSRGHSWRRNRCVQERHRRTEHLYRSGNQQRGVRNGEMKITRSPAGLLGLAMLLCAANVALAQWEPEVRRARPIDEPPAPRALPADESIDRVLRSLKEDSSQAPKRESQGGDQRQLEYANGLFARKLYDLAIPEYQKYLEDYPGRSGRANAYFSLGECYRNLN